MDAAAEKALFDTVEELKSKLATAESTLADKVKQLEGLQSVHQRHGTELGEIRKQTDALATARAEIDKLKADLEKAIDDVKKNFKGSAPEGGQPKKVEEMTADEVEAALSPQQRTAVEEVYKTLPDDDPNAAVDKKRVANDPEVRKSFFAAALAEAPSIPDSPWKKPNEQKKPAADAMRDLFRTELRRSTFVPPGPSESRSPISGGMLRVLEEKRKELKTA